jgi:hypothetical protein
MAKNRFLKSIRDSAISFLSFLVRKNGKKILEGQRLPVRRTTGCVTGFYENLAISPVVDSVWLLFDNGGGSGGTSDVKRDDGSTFVGGLRTTGVID